MHANVLQKFLPAVLSPLHELVRASRVELTLRRVNNQQNNEEGKSTFNDTPEIISKLAAVTFISRHNKQILH